MTPPDDGREASGTGEDAAPSVASTADVVLSCAICSNSWVEHWLGAACRTCARPGLVMTAPRSMPAAPREGQPVWLEPFDLLYFAPKPRPPAVVRAPGRQMSSRVVVARFDGLVHNLRGAVEGERNGRLHWVACRVGEMLAAGELPDAGLAADALATVGLEIGLDPGEIVGTINSGFGASDVVT